MFFRKPAIARTIVLLGLFTLVHSAIASAEEPPVTQTAKEAAKWPDCEGLSRSPPPAPFVTAAYRLTPKVRAAAATPPGVVPVELRHRDVRLRNEVVIEVKNLDTLLRQRECAAALGPKPPIVLYLDERPLHDVFADPPVDPQQNAMIFPLKRTEKSRDVWTHLLGKPTLDSREVAVSLGLDDRFAIPSSVYLDLDVIRGNLAIGLALGFVVLAAFFWRLAQTTGLLRDSGSPESENSKKPWSLARVQAAWWFFIILLAYLFIGIVTGDFSTTITGTTLVLLSIAAGTTLTSAVIDTSKDTPDQRSVEEAAKQRVAIEIKSLQGGTPADAPAQKSDEQANKEKLVALQSQLKKLEGKKEGFLRDILSDANGVSFHRFQIATWTAVLGGVFVCAVFRELAMPQFSDTLLGLMGLSAGTFVAMKTTEPNAPK